MSNLGVNVLGCLRIIVQPMQMIEGVVHCQIASDNGIETSPGIIVAECIARFLRIDDPFLRVLLRRWSARSRS